MSGNSTQRQSFEIDGMHCTSCGITIDWELEDVEGVDEASTSYAKGVTEVEFDPAVVTQADIVDAIGRAGFTARPAGVDGTTGTAGTPGS